jgi:SWI/SNF-related matrix-associated actin-dependent regulator 1 of chromatin subfamily A
MPDLLPNQRAALDWLGTGHAFLVMDMGLGKTATAIAHARKSKNSSFLIVVPAGLRIHWAREFDLFWPGHPDVELVMSSTQRIGPASVVVVNYDLLIYPSILNQLRVRTWDMLVCDESQMANNLETKRGAAILGRDGLVKRSGQVICLSGTPAPNHIGELHGWFSALVPHLLKGSKEWPDVTSYYSFLTRYAKFKVGQYGITVLGSRNAGEFRKRFSGVILRQRKSEVMKDLPPLRMGAVTIEADDLGELRALLDHPDYAGLKLAMENLRADAPDAMARLREALSSTHLATLRRLVAIHKIDPVARLIREELVGGDNKLVVFAHHRQLLEGLHSLLYSYGLYPAMVHGGVPPKERQRQVDHFQNFKRCRVFLGQLDAAGTGYTLTAASDVLMAESSWSPSKNLQAINRVSRIGQKNACLARFVSLAGSVDEIVNMVQLRKLDALNSLLL